MAIASEEFTPVRGGPVSQQDFARIDACLRASWNEPALEAIRRDADELLTRMRKQQWPEDSYLTLAHSRSNAMIAVGLDKWTEKTFQKAKSHLHTAFAYACKKLKCDTFTARLVKDPSSDLYRLEWGFHRKQRTVRPKGTQSSSEDGALAASDVRSQTKTHSYVQQAFSTNSGMHFLEDAITQDQTFPSPQGPLTGEAQSVAISDGQLVASILPPLQSFHPPQPVFAQESRFSQSPSTEAARAALSVLKVSKLGRPLTVRQIQTPAELEELWDIDRRAYASASISLELFKTWWHSFPAGLSALFRSDSVIGAVGIWPLSHKWAKRFKDGLASETEITARMLTSFRNAPTAHWYVSGIVLLPTATEKKGVKLLLENALSAWLASGRLKFPLELLAMEFSPEGGRLLQRFSFLRLQNANAMPDGYSLFMLRFDTRATLIESLHSRGLSLSEPQSKRRHAR